MGDRSLLSDSGFGMKIGQILPFLWKWMSHFPNSHASLNTGTNKIRNHCLKALEDLYYFQKEGGVLIEINTAY